MKNQTLILAVAAIIIMCAIFGGIYYFNTLQTPSPSPLTSPSPSPLPEPTPHRWLLMIVRAFLWEDGREQFIASSQSNLTNFLIQTFHRINHQINCSLNEENAQEIKENDKVVVLSYRFTEDITINQWIKPELRDGVKTDEEGYRILEKIRSAIFILKDDLNEGLEAQILVHSLNDDGWSCWAIQQDGELDESWIEEIGRFLLTPVEIYLPFQNGTESKLLLIDSHLRYGVFEENITIIPKGRSAMKGDPAVIIKGKVINHYDEEYYFAITCDLYNSQGQKLEGTEYIFNPPVGEFAVTYVNDHGTFEIYLKYEGRDITHYDLFLALDPQETPPP